MEAGSAIVIGVLVVGLLSVIYGYYTIRGSGINRHPSDGLDGAPGSKGPSEASGQGRVTGNANDSVTPGQGGMAAGDTFSNRGTDSSKRSRKP